YQNWTGGLREAIVSRQHSELWFCVQTKLSNSYKWPLSARPDLHISTVGARPHYLQPVSETPLATNVQQL
ncbi:Hypothetical predicted protein, partial [Scomber scombrus]